jgi:dTDP-4-amino-4,6-dideoxygalactose transaminase
LIPLSIPDLSDHEIEYLTHCVEDNWVSSAGPFVTEREEGMAALCKCSYGVAAVSGTAVIHLALMGLDKPPGNSVVVPDWTFGAMANAVMHAGATPVLVDVNAENWTLDPHYLRRALAGEDSRIKVIVAVHALGHPAGMDSILEIADVHGVPLIKDAAGALGATYRGAPVGSFGVAEIFSFNGNKTVTAGRGGAIVTSGGVLADRMRHIRTQARVSQDYCVYANSLLGANAAGSRHDLRERCRLRLIHYKHVSPLAALYRNDIENLATALGNALNWADSMITTLQNRPGVWFDDVRRAVNIMLRPPEQTLVCAL